VGLGNATSSFDLIASLKSREYDKSELVREHVAWALRQHQN
jgi:epoxyqueuosine reductase